MDAPITRSYFYHFMAQTLAASLFMYLVLFSLDHVQAASLIWAAGASTLASSCFIVFGAPHTESAKPYIIITGYLITMVCGYFIHLLADSFCGSFANLCHDPNYLKRVYEVAATVALAIAFIAMALFRCAHPPAAGLAIVMVLEVDSYQAMMVIFFAAVVLALIRLIFGKVLKRLV